MPQFTEHYYESDDEGDASVDNGPTGGLTWDGRADRGRDQARIPLLSPFEMANADEAAVAAKIRRAGYANEFVRIFGDDLFKDEGKTYAAAVEALEVFEQSERDFYPYSSKYDAYLAGRAKLTEQEARGLALFNAEDKGNCASCHRSAPDNNGTPPQFTDYGLIALGLPRNRNIPANADANYFDLGACGPLRTDLAGRAEYCGLFRTPSLRNVALRKTFYHNGASTICARPSASMSSAIPDPRNGIRARPTARSPSSTTCRRSIAATSTTSRRSAASRATGRRCRTPRSTISSPFSTR